MYIEASRHLTKQEVAKDWAGIRYLGSIGGGKCPIIGGLEVGGFGWGGGGGVEDLPDVEFPYVL